MNSTSTAQFATVLHYSIVTSLHPHLLLVSQLLPSLNLFANCYTLFYYHTITNLTGDLASYWLYADLITIMLVATPSPTTKQSQNQVTADFTHVYSH